MSVQVPYHKQFAIGLILFLVFLLTIELIAQAYLSQDDSCYQELEQSEIYVGKSENGCCSRISDHNKKDSVNSEWDSKELDKRNKLQNPEPKKFNRVLYKEFKHSNINLKTKEDEYIKRYLPKYNLCPIALRERKKIMGEKKTIIRFLRYNEVPIAVQYIKKHKSWKIITNEKNKSKEKNDTSK